MQRTNIRLGCSPAVLGFCPGSEQPRFCRSIPAKVCSIDGSALLLRNSFVTIAPTWHRASIIYFSLPHFSARSFPARRHASFRFQCRRWRKAWARTCSGFLGRCCRISFPTSACRLCSGGFPIFGDVRRCSPWVFWSLPLVHCSAVFPRRFCI